MRRRRLGLAELPARQFAFVVRVRIAVEAQGAGFDGFAQDAAPVSLQDGRPKMLAAPEIGEICARAIHQQAVAFVCHADRIAAGALHFAKQMLLVGFCNPHGVGVKEIHPLELEASFKLEC